MPAIGSPSKALPNAKTEKNDPAPVPSASSQSR
jgi:hypothetical protein